VENTKDMPETSYMEQAYRQSQWSANGHGGLNTLLYKDVRWVVLAPLAEPSHSNCMNAFEVQAESHWPMLVSHAVVIALFSVVAATFPDASSGAAVDIPETVARAQQGDRNAVAALYQLHAERVFRYIVIRVPTTADAEDLTAEVFVSMVKGLATYQSTGAPFEAWLYRIAASRVADFYRQSGRRPQTTLSETLHDSEATPEEQILQKQTLDQLRSVLQQLPEDYQTILILRFVERKSHEEVALLLDKSVSAVKNLQYRALLRLTELLGTDHKVRHYLRGHHE
jgi:RNA polymerase sigma-70 factor (ECF subfamily)